MWYLAHVCPFYCQYCKTLRITLKLLCIEYIPVYRLQPWSKPVCNIYVKSVLDKSGLGFRIKDMFKQCCQVICFIRYVSRVSAAWHLQDADPGQLAHTRRAMKRLGWSCLYTAETTSNLCRTWIHQCWQTTLCDWGNHSVQQWNQIAQLAYGNRQSVWTNAQPASHSTPALQQQNIVTNVWCCHNYVRAQHERTIGPCLGLFAWCVMPPDQSRACL